MKTVLLANGVEVTESADIELNAESVSDLSLGDLCQPLGAAVKPGGYVILSTPPAEQAIGIDRSPAQARFPTRANDRDAIYIAPHNQVVEVEVEWPVTTSTEETAALIAEGNVLNALSLLRAEHKDYGEGPACTLFLQCSPETMVETLTFECHLAIALLRGAQPELNTPEDVLRHLRHGAWRRFLGQAETQWLEFKLEMYRLQEELQKHELALDIASFANSPEGGVIVIGFKTKPDPHGRDVVVKAKGSQGMKKSISQIENLISQRIYPVPEQLSVQIFTKADREVVAIGVPPQAPSRHPFLVVGQKVSTDKYSGIGFSWVERIGGSKRSVSVARMHSLIQG